MLHTPFLHTFKRTLFLIISQQMINMVAPHLLPDEDGNEASNMSRDDEEYPVSALDSGVFRSRSRAFRKSAEES